MEIRLIFAARVSWESGQWPCHPFPLPTFLAHSVQLAMYIWLRFFVFIRGTIFLGSGRTSFRFLGHCVPPCLILLLLLLLLLLLHRRRFLLLLLLLLLLLRLLLLILAKNVPELVCVDAFVSEHGCKYTSHATHACTHACMLCSRARVYKYADRFLLFPLFLFRRQIRP